MATQAPHASPQSVPAPSRGLDVSVIVPVRNGGPSLAKLVEALCAQTLPRERFEVLIADDGSTDGSTADLATDDGWVRVLSAEPINSYAARNRAADAARAPILAFSDADCRPDVHWLERGTAAMRDADIVGGLILPTLPRRPTLWTLLDLDMHVDHERAIREGRGLGGNLFVRSDLFHQLRGFDDSVPRTGDGQFVSRAAGAGARVSFSSDAVVWHPTHDHAGAFLRKVWTIHRSHGMRARKEGVRPRLLSKGLIPVVGMLRARRHGGRPLRIDRDRLGESAADVRFRTELGALIVLYLVLPYLARTARLVGWWQAARSPNR